jgi:hypothetical protein
MSESVTIKAQDALAPGKKINEPADKEVLNRRSIAVESGDRLNRRCPPILAAQASPTLPANPI